MIKGKRRPGEIPESEPVSWDKSKIPKLKLIKQRTGNVLAETYSNIKSRTIVTYNNRKIIDLVPLFKKEKKITTLGKQI